MDVIQTPALRGGLRLTAHKETAQASASRRLNIPARLVLPLQQHVGVVAQPRVAVGQEVMKGELLAEAKAYVGMRLHAPTSGTVTSIDQFPVIHPGGASAKCIEIHTDGRDRAAPRSRHRDPVAMSPEQIYRAIAAAGIVGLGGAGFPAHVKFREGDGQRVDVLIVNGVECEPFINCDDCVIREYPEALVAGALVLARALGAERCVLAIEADMPAAQSALQQHVRDGAEIAVVPAIYPAGGERQLIKAPYWSRSPEWITADTHRYCCDERGDYLRDLSRPVLR